MKRWIYGLLMTSLLTTVVADDEAPAAPAKTDRCAVCGMFVAKYKPWVAVVTIGETSHYFDGCKCMFRYLQSPARYGADPKTIGAARIHVTDYYDTKLINGRKAFYVTGSDVLGPMGHELIPFKTRAEAEAFMADHKGKALLQFSEIEPATIKALMHRR
jgi:nitrous oxide reductase accessory protein NosL